MGNLRGKTMMSMIHSIAAFFQRLFAPKSDNFKSLLIADLGIER